MMTDLISIFIKAVFGAGCELIHEHSFRTDELFDGCLWKRSLRSEYPYLTEEKISQILSLYQDNWSKDPDKSENKDFFYVFAHFVNGKAVLQDKQVCVRLEELLRWRQVSYAIGEDVLVCAWLAYRFRWSSQCSWNAEWNMSCEVEDPDLRYLYKKGLTDLHHHLKASTDVFSLSWICLMNHITHRYLSFGKVGADRLQVPKLYKMVYRAAAIRIALYNYLKDNSLECDIHLLDDIDDFTIEKKVEALQSQINFLSGFSYGTREKRILDYALFLCEDADNNPLHIYDGERNLQFGILRAIYRGCLDQEELSILLFCYLNVKTALRRYLVQTNDNVGFSNFSKYERRKDLFLEGYPEYERMLSLLPVMEGKNFHHLEYLETRLAPKADIRKARKSIEQMICDWNKYQSSNALSPSIIFHFIKQNEDVYKPFQERHHKLRVSIKKQVLTLMTLRRRMCGLFDKFVGIDAANTELDCRPEVFAHVFRYVKLHADDICQRQHHTLHYTYHAGEDFYDIVDGLRAIEEAVRLLGLSRGDRLGHCIALGLEPSAYYSQYEYNVVVKKQYLLDNIVWMFYQSKKYSVMMSSRLKSQLEDRYKILVYELYQREVDMDAYYMAMLLRGDDPQVSVSDQGKMNGQLLSNWDSCALDPDERLARVRTNLEVLHLYWEYHFSSYVREKGGSMELIHVDDEYVQLVRLLQESMMDELANKGIVIECCPSSNLKIGLANRYDQQPIFRFCPIKSVGRRMAVTINTDDLGIFQTSVDNEYSLLALSAFKVKDEQGRHLYTKYETIRWLEEVAENGFKYAFGRANRKK